MAQFVARGNNPRGESQFDHRSTTPPVQTVSRVSTRRRENIAERGGIFGTLANVLFPASNLLRDTDKGFGGQLGNLISGQVTGVADLLGGGSELTQQGLVGLEETLAQRDLSGFDPGAGGKAIIGTVDQAFRSEEFARALGGEGAAEATRKRNEQREIAETPNLNTPVGEGLPDGAQATLEQTMLDSANALDQRARAIELAQRNPNLDPENQELLDREAATVAEETAELNRQIDMLLNTANAASGLMAVRDGATPEEVLAREELISRVDLVNIDEEMGIDADFIDEVMSAFNEGNEGLVNSLFDQESLKQRMLVEVNNLIENKKDFADGLENYEADLLAAQRRQESPPLAYDVPPSELAIAEDAFLIGIDQLNTDHLPASQETLLLDSMLSMYAIGRETFNQTELNPIATQFRLDVSALERAMNAGFDLSEAAEADVNERFDKARYDRGSYAFPMATYDSLTRRGVPADFAHQWANDGMWEKIMIAKSSGVVNYEATTGDQKGLFGLPEEVYNFILGDAQGWETAKNNAELQMFVAYNYIRERFGDPQSAYDSAVKNNDWGM